MPVMVLVQRYNLPYLFNFISCLHSNALSHQHFIIVLITDLSLTLTNIFSEPTFKMMFNGYTLASSSADGAQSSSSLVNIRICSNLFICFNCTYSNLFIYFNCSYSNLFIYFNRSNSYSNLFYLFLFDYNYSCDQ